MSFEVQIVLTELCNLKCKYCYIDQKNNPMTKDIFDKHHKMIPKLMDFYKKNDYNVVFFGGEPLMNWKVFEYGVSVLQKDPFCKKIVVVTNALLLTDPKKLEFIKENNINLSISFDGLWNHNNRILHNGNSSFDFYTTEPLKGLIQKHGGCKVMISPDSVSTMVENFEFFVNEMEILTPDFTLVRDDIWTDENIDEFLFTCRELANKTIEYFKAGIPAFPGIFRLYTLDLIYGKIYGKRQFCCYAGHHGAGFMPDGKIFPCARFGSNGKLQLADSITEELFPTIQNLKKERILNPRTFKKCEKCNLKQFCNAGCTYNQINSYDKYNISFSEPVQSLCELLQICYAETMRITEELKNNSLFKDYLKNTLKNMG